MQNTRKAHNKFTFTLPDQNEIIVRSDFDSGNLQTAILSSVSQIDDIYHVKIQLSPASEPFNPQYSTRQSLKNFFHFSLCAKDKPIVMHAIIKKMDILSIIENSFEEYYHVCVGFKNSALKEPQYEKIKAQNLALLKVGEQNYLSFTYEIEANQITYFSYHFPYSVEKLRIFLQHIQEKVKQRNHNTKTHHHHTHHNHHNKDTFEQLYYCNQLLIQSLQMRPINLLTITSYLDCESRNQGNRQPRISKSLFPYYDIEKRPYKFNKPIVMLTCRVHPGETSASFGLEGFIHKILDQSPQSQFLRKAFVFMIVPMLNPDGVYHGTYRMDTSGANLNRFYNGCAPHKQPSIFAVTTLLQHHSDEIIGYFDIHSHPALKGSFFYGNAFSSFIDQIQSQLFAKLFSINSQSFVYQLSSFSQKNMNSKDINDILTKDGSGRVCAYKKIALPIFCYTLEMGYHGYPIKKQPITSSAFKSSYRRDSKKFVIIDYMEEGSALALTLAQTFLQNIKIPNNTLPQPSEITNNNTQTLRQEVGKDISQKDDRFRIMDGGLGKKIKNSHKEIYQTFYSKIVKKFSNMEQSIKFYYYLIAKQEQQKDKRQNYHVLNNQTDFKPIHSLEMRQKNNNRNFQHLDLTHIYRKNQDEKRKMIRNSEYIFGAGLKNHRKIRLSEQINQKQEFKQISKIIRSKANVVTPIQFLMPEETKKNLKRGSSTGSTVNNNINSNNTNAQSEVNNLMNVNIQALPKIQKKKVRLVSNRSRQLHNKRVSSSLNNQKVLQEAQNIDLKFNKMTIANQMHEIIDFQGKINHILQEKQYEDLKQKFADPNKRKQSQQSKISDYYSNNNHNPQGNEEIISNTNAVEVHNRRNFTNRQKSREQNLKNYQTDRLHHKNSHVTQQSNAHNHHNLSTSRKQRMKKNNVQLMSTKEIQNQSKKKKKKNSEDNILPKLQGKTERIYNRFDLELKLKEKYDKQYFIE